MIRTAAFLGGHQIQPDSQDFIWARDTAKLCAKAGLTVINGGGPGIMRASTQGAHDGGGQVLAITTYYGGYGRSDYEGVDKENTFDKEIIATDYFERTEKLLRMGDVHLFFRGTQGTLSEFAMSWEVSLLHKGNNKPIILFGDFWKGILTAIEREMYIKQGTDLLYKIVNSAEEAMDIINSYRSKADN